MGDVQRQRATREKVERDLTDSKFRFIVETLSQRSRAAQMFRSKLRLTGARETEASIYYTKQNKSVVHAGNQCPQAAGRELGP